MLTRTSWTAICRGAVLKALTNSALPGPIVQTRISRCNYGTRYHTDYNPTKHLQCDRYLDTVSGRPKARNQLQWYLKRVGSLHRESYIADKASRVTTLMKQSQYDFFGTSMPQPINTATRIPWQQTSSHVTIRSHQADRHRTSNRVPKSNRRYPSIRLI